MDKFEQELERFFKAGLFTVGVSKVLYDAHHKAVQEQVVAELERLLEGDMHFEETRPLADVIVDRIAELTPKEGTK